jgi:predicted Zn-dependent protease
MFRHAAPLSLCLLLILQPGPRARADNINLPDLGDASATTISPAQERKLGEDFMRRARRSLGFLDDPELNAYLQSLGNRIVGASDSPQRDFRFFLINDPSINAFAVPGGFIGVHTGLILAAQSEAELASVLAHETAHITQHHIPRLMAEQERATLPAMAAILASILLASSGKPGAEAGIVATQAALAQQGLNYTRAFEEEADRIGMQLLAKSGLDANAMPSFFERMQALNRYNESSLPEFLRTHPVTTNRIADARNRAAQYPVRPRPDSADFHYARAKLRALNASNPQDAVREFRANLAQGKYRLEDAERYGLALALLRAQDFEAARTEAKQLAARQPARVGHQVLRAEIEIAAGRAQEGLAIYAAAERRHPGNEALLRYHAAALLKANRAREARDLLKPVLRQPSDDPALYRMYGTALGELGERAEAHRALGEYYYLSGNPSAAIQQLEIAARHAGDNFYLVSGIEARIAAIKEELALYQPERR